MINDLSIRTYYFLTCKEKKAKTDRISYQNRNSKRELKLDNKDIGFAFEVPCIESSSAF